MAIEEMPSEMLLLGILDELQEPMCQIIAEHVKTYDKISDWIVDLDAEEEVAKAKILPLKTVDELFSEYGCTICNMGSAQPHRLMDRPTHAQVGTRVSISETECRYAGGEVTGHYHTHPFALAVPSNGDIVDHFLTGRQVDFIGGRMNDKAVLVGYGSRSDSQIKYEMQQKIEPYLGDIWKGAYGVIRLMIRPPGSRWVEGSERVHSIPVYDEFDAIRQFWTQVESLKRFFDVVVRWC